MRPQDRAVVEATITSLRRAPHEWRRNRYSAVHCSGRVSVWTANGYFAVSILAGEYPAPMLIGQNNTLWGWLVPWRRRLLAAALSIPTDDDKARPALRTTVMSALLGA